MSKAIIIIEVEDGSDKLSVDTDYCGDEQSIPSQIAKFMTDTFDMTQKAHQTMEEQTSKILQPPKDIILPH